MYKWIHLTRGLVINECRTLGFRESDGFGKRSVQSPQHSTQFFQVYKLLYEIYYV